MAHALVVVDVQRDFCEGGSLPVSGGIEVAGRINELLTDPAYDVVVATRDYHRDPGAHFSETPDYVDSWPPHCVIGTPGEQFRPELDAARFQAVFSKGESAAAYSGFEGHADGGARLAEWLREQQVDAVDIVGIATDHCVRATAIDAVKEGFATRVLLGFTAGVARPTTELAVDSMRAAGVELVGEPVLVD
jgi:nicotinamidase/pyrazinamidase